MMMMKMMNDINETINKAFSVLGLIYRNFKHMSATSFIILYKTLIRSHLEHANYIQTDGCRESRKGADES